MYSSCDNRSTVREGQQVLPALQVEQVKKGCFEAIYEDNVWKVKPYSNDQNRKSVIEYLFFRSSQNAICQERALQDTFQERIATLFC